MRLFQEMLTKFTPFATGSTYAHSERKFLRSVAQIFETDQYSV